MTHSEPRDGVAEPDALQRQLERTRAELDELRESYSRFAFAASHDLNEPLEKIHAFLRLLRLEAGPALSADCLSYIDYIHQAADRMESLLAGLLQFSRIETRPQPAEPTRLDACLDDQLAQLGPRIEELGATIVREPLGQVLADPLQLQMLFSHLLDNALKFCHEESPPHITIEGRSRGKRSENETPFYEVSISDKGIGFDREHAERIFEPFLRLNPRSAYPGNGLGLAVCKKIIARNGGLIAARGKLGEGCKVRFMLPEVEGGSSK